MMALLLLFLTFSLSILTKQSFSFITLSPLPHIQQRQKVLSMSANSKIIIRKGSNDDIPRVARFLSESMYSNVPTAQRRELARLEQADLTERYGERVSSKNALPCALFVAEEDEEIVGAVGLDCQLYRSKRNKIVKIPRNYFSKLKAKIDLKDDSNDDGVDVEEDQSRFDSIVFVLANLSVRQDKRKRGIARSLLDACDAECKELGCEDIYLLVDSENIAAQNLYKSSGYSLLFEDPDSTCVISTVTGLQTTPCVNLCFNKDLRKKANIIAPLKKTTDMLSGLFSMFTKKKQ